VDAPPPKTLERMTKGELIWRVIWQSIGGLFFSALGFGVVLFLMSWYFQEDRFFHDATNVVVGMIALILGVGGGTCNGVYLLLEAVNTCKVLERKVKAD